eukprot:11228358-Lingulodinium_polyedra.AAC.5
MHSVAHATQCAGCSVRLEACGMQCAARSGQQAMCRMYRAGCARHLIVSFVVLRRVSCNML